MEFVVNLTLICFRDNLFAKLYFKRIEKFNKYSIDEKFPKKEKGRIRKVIKG